jgi:signal-transduction protein with cAMP-binding, CBS, and nucleotidyltransferase domain
MIPLRQYEAGETILKENEMGETAYIIEHDKVEVTKKSDGKDLHIAYIGAGETFGEMGMIDEKPRSATIVDEQMSGGKDGAVGSLYFQGDEGLLVIGNSKSPFKYKIRIHQPD